MVAPYGSEGRSLLGSYDPEKRREQCLDAFERRALEKRRERREKLGLHNELTWRKPEPVKIVDPVMDELNGMLEEIRKLVQEVDDYKNIHIDQECRRIYVTLVNFLEKLDRVAVGGREDARKLRKEGIRMSEKGADALMAKIHVDDVDECTVCLKL